jgi:phenylalanyl-tRNA synthetase beta chain
MKFTLSWLKDHLDTNASLDDISKTLTAIGLEVESITDASESLKVFTVAKILEATRHPEADKLQVCKVESNAGILQIVCGAPNARAGLYVALAQEGAFIPGSNFTIKKTKIRGVESNGMLCSFEELGIAGDSTGIIEMPEATIGASVAKTLGLDDPLIDIAITPNRADCLGVRGVARDLAAAGLGTLKPLAAPPLSLSGKSPISVSITSANCQQFIGCFIKDVKNGESPEWLKKRLAAIDLRPISALVDITNYFTYDLGRPLHVYDAKKLTGNITVRDAKAGEKINALNDKEYTLEDGMCVIADDKAPVAIAGVIGGADTGCELDTTDVFLEVALFTPTHVATVGRKLAIDSDARYRFERNVDAAFVDEGAKLAVAMIQKLCGGSASELVVAGSTPPWKRDIAFNPARVKTLGGVDIAADKIEKILISLGFTTNHQLSAVTPPSWRADVEGEADIVEEVLRIHGYDNLPVLPLPKLSDVKLATPDRVMQAKRMLAASGYLEICSYSFIPQSQAKRFGGGTEALALANPISEDLSDMRPNLLPNLLVAAQKNHYRGFKNLRLAEVGLTYQNPSPSGQQMNATALLTGEVSTHEIDGKLFKTTAKPVGAMDAKRDAMNILFALGIKKFEFTTATPTWYHPGRSGAIVLGKNILATFGELHPALLKEFDIATSACAFEIFLENIPTPRAKTKAKPKLELSDYQVVTRDFAFVVENKISSAELVKAIAAAEKNLITDITIFDVYAGKGVEDGKKSVALQVTLQAPDRTLSDAEITGVSQNIIASVGKIGGVLRA